MKTKWNSDYYSGAIESYEKELIRAEEAGVIFRNARLEQFKMMLEDYKALEKITKSMDHAILIKVLSQAHMEGQRHAGCEEPSYGDARAIAEQLIKEPF